MKIAKWNDETETVFREYTQAVWEFIVEHCDVLPTGKMFVKFHTDGKQDFEKRVWARWRLGYHRENPEKKEEFILNLRERYKIKRAEKQKRRDAEKERVRQFKTQTLSDEDMKTKIKEVADINNKRYGKPVPFWKKIFSLK